MKLKMCWKKICTVLSIIENGRKTSVHQKTPEVAAATTFKGSAKIRVACVHRNTCGHVNLGQERMRSLELSINFSVGEKNFKEKKHRDSESLFTVPILTTN